MSSSPLRHLFIFAIPVVTFADPASHFCQAMAQLLARSRAQVEAGKETAIQNALYDALLDVRGRGGRGEVGMFRFRNVVLGFRILGVRSRRIN